MSDISVGISWTLIWGTALCAEAFEVEPAKSNSSAIVQTDSQGDPLPAGAVRRLGTSRFRLADRWKGLSYCPNGEFVATACGRQIVRWDARSGKALAPVDGDGDIDAFAFSADGKRYAVLVNQRPGYLVKVVNHDGEAIFSAAAQGGVWAIVGMSPDGRLVAFGDRGGNLVVHDLDADQTTTLVTVERDSQLRCLSFSPDGRWLAVARWKGFNFNIDKPIDVLVHDLRKKGAAIVLPDHGAQALGISFSGDGSSLASYLLDSEAENAKVVIWDVVNRVVRRSLPKGRAPLALNPDATRCICARFGDFDHLDVWDVERGVVLRRIATGGISPEFVALSPDGKRVAAGGDLQAIAVWDVATGADVFSFPGHECRVDSISFASGGKTLGSIGGDHTFRLWDVATSGQRRVLRLARPLLEHQANALTSFSSDGSRIAGLVRDNLGVKMRVWNGRNAELISEWKPNEKVIVMSGVGMLAGGSVVAVVIPSGVRFYSAVDGKPLNELIPVAPEPEMRLGIDYTLSVTASERVMALAPQHEPLVRLYDYPSRRWLRDIRVERGRRLFTRFASNAAVLVTACRAIEGDPIQDHRRVLLWEVVTGGRLGELGDARPGGLFDVALSADNRFVATAEQERAEDLRPRPRIRIWSMVSGKEVASFDGGQGRVHCLEFSPDGKLLATGGQDGTILLWDVSKLDSALGPKPGARDVAAAWEVLGGSGGDGVLRAVYTLAAAGDEAVALIRGKVRPAPGVDAKEVAKLLVGLDDESFAVRSEAAGRLAELGETARPALEKASAVGSGSAEYRKQVRRLLDDAPVRTPTGEGLRSLRAVWVLEEIGSEAALKCLRDLTEGASASPLTVAAREAVRRLEAKR